MCSNSYLNHYIKVGQLPKCMVSCIESTGQLLMKRVVSSSDICNENEDIQKVIETHESRLSELLDMIMYGIAKKTEDFSENLR